MRDNSKIFRTSERAAELLAESARRNAQTPGEDDPLCVARQALDASTRAFDARDYEQADRLAERGIDHLPDDAFDLDYDLAFALHFMRCECACALHTDLEQLDAMCIALWNRAHTRLERTHVTALRVWQLGARGRPTKAIQIGLQAFAEMGFDIRRKPFDDLRAQLWEDIQELVGDRSIEEMVDELPVVLDPDLVGVAELFVAVGYPLWSIDPDRMSALALYMARSTLRDGTTPASGLALAAGGLDIAYRIGDFQRGLKFGRAGVRLAERLDSHVSETRELVDEFIEQSQGQSIAEFQEKRPEVTGRLSQAIEDIKLASISPPLEMPEPAFETFDAPENDTENDTENHGSILDRPSVLVHTADTEPVYSHATHRRDPKDTHVRILSICDLIRGNDDKHRSALDVYRERLMTLMAELEQHRRLIAEGEHEAHYQLAAAEIARVVGELLMAEAHYERASAVAEKLGLFGAQGHANELAGRFYLDRGMRTAARAYLEEAWNCYQNAGMVTKLVFMPGQYPGLLRIHMLNRAESSSDRAGDGEQETRTPKKRRQSRIPQAAHLDVEAIETALTRNNGVRSRAAKELGVSRQALYRRMKQLGM